MDPELIALAQTMDPRAFRALLERQKEEEQKKYSQQKQEPNLLEQAMNLAALGALGYGGYRAVNAQRTRDQINRATGQTPRFMPTFLSPGSQRDRIQALSNELANAPDPVTRAALIQELNDLAIAVDPQLANQPIAPSGTGQAQQIETGQPQPDPHYDDNPGWSNEVTPDTGMVAYQQRVDDVLTQQIGSNITPEMQREMEALSRSVGNVPVEQALRNMDRLEQLKAQSMGQPVPTGQSAPSAQSPQRISNDVQYISTPDGGEIASLYADRDAVISTVEIANRLLADPSVLPGGAGQAQQIETVKAALRAAAQKNDAAEVAYHTKRLAAAMDLKQEDLLNLTQQRKQGAQSMGQPVSSVPSAPSAQSPHFQPGQTNPTDPNNSSQTNPAPSSQVSPAPSPMGGVDPGVIQASALLSALPQVSSAPPPLDPAAPTQLVGEGNSTGYRPDAEAMLNAIASEASPVDNLDPQVVAKAVDQIAQTADPRTRSGIQASANRLIQAPDPTAQATGLVAKTVINPNSVLPQVQAQTTTGETTNMQIEEMVQAIARPEVQRPDGSGDYQTVVSGDQLSPSEWRAQERASRRAEAGARDRRATRLAKQQLPFTRTLDQRMAAARPEENDWRFNTTETRWNPVTRAYEEWVTPLHPDGSLFERGAPARSTNNPVYNLYADLYGDASPTQKGNLASLMREAYVGQRTLPSISVPVDGPEGRSLRPSLPESYYQAIGMPGDALPVQLPADAATPQFIGERVANPEFQVTDARRRGNPNYQSWLSRRVTREMSDPTSLGLFPITVSENLASATEDSPFQRAVNKAYHDVNMSLESDFQGKNKERLIDLQKEYNRIREIAKGPGKQQALDNKLREIQALTDQIKAQSFERIRKYSDDMNDFRVNQTAHKLFTGLDPNRYYYTLHDNQGGKPFKIWHEITPDTKLPDYYNPSEIRSIGGAPAVRGLESLYPEMKPWTEMSQSPQEFASNYGLGLRKPYTTTAQDAASGLHGSFSYYNPDRQTVTQFAPGYVNPLTGELIDMAETLTDILPPFGESIDDVMERATSTYDNPEPGAFRTGRRSEEQRLSSFTGQDVTDFVLGKLQPQAIKPTGTPAAVYRQQQYRLRDEARQFPENSPEFNERWSESQRLGALAFRESLNDEIADLAKQEGQLGNQIESSDVQTADQLAKQLQQVRERRSQSERQLVASWASSLPKDDADFSKPSVGGWTQAKLVDYLVPPEDRWKYTGGQSEGLGGRSSLVRTINDAIDSKDPWLNKALLASEVYDTQPGEYIDLGRAQLQLDNTLPADSNVLNMASQSSVFANTQNLTPEQVAQVVASSTTIPVQNLTRDLADPARQPVTLATRLDAPLSTDLALGQLNQKLVAADRLDALSRVMPKLQLTGDADGTFYVSPSDLNPAPVASPNAWNQYLAPPKGSVTPLAGDVLGRDEVISSILDPDFLSTVGPYIDPGELGFRHLQEPLKKLAVIRDSSNDVVLGQQPLSSLVPESDPDAPLLRQLADTGLELTSLGEVRNADGSRRQVMRIKNPYHNPDRYAQTLQAIETNRQANVGVPVTTSRLNRFSDAEPRPTPDLDSQAVVESVIENINQGIAPEQNRVLAQFPLSDAAIQTDIAAAQAREARKREASNLIMDAIAQGKDAYVPGAQPNPTVEQAAAMQAGFDEIQARRAQERQAQQEQAVASRAVFDENRERAIANAFAAKTGANPDAVYAARRIAANKGLLADVAPPSPPSASVLSAGSTRTEMPLGVSIADELQARGIRVPLPAPPSPEQIASQISASAAGLSGEWQPKTAPRSPEMMERMMQDIAESKARRSQLEQMRRANQLRRLGR